MVEVTTVTAEPAGLRGASASNAPLAQRRTRRAYLAISLAVVAIVGWGFWPSYFRPLLHGGVHKFWIIHVHAAIFIGWLILVVTQASLVATGHIDLHRRVGTVGIAYGILVSCIGSIISFASPILHVQAHQMPVERASLTVLYNLTDMLVFSGFFAAAIIYRRTPELHKRLILSATVGLASAAVGRVLPGGSLVYLLVWLTPIFAAMAVDLWVKRRVHPVWLISVPIFVLTFIQGRDLFHFAHLAHSGPGAHRSVLVMYPVDCA